MVVTSYYPLVGGGEKQTELLSARLQARGVRVTVLTRRSQPDWPRETVHGGVRVIRVGSSNRWVSTCAMVAWIARHRREVDLIHAQGTDSNLVASVLAGRAVGIPVVCTPFTAWPALKWLSGSGTRAARRWLFRGVRSWLSKSDDISEALEAFAPGRVHRVPNGIDDRLYQASPASRQPTAIFVGRLDRPKRVDLLLAAWSALSTRVPLWIVGDGPLAGSLRRQATQLGLTNVEFLGRRDDVPTLLRSADVFVFASDSEGMPNALLEAMSSGLACVATGVGQIPVMLEGGAGIVVESGSSAALARAITPLLDDAALRSALGQAARERALARYSIDAIVDLVLRVYDWTFAREQPPCVA